MRVNNTNPLVNTLASKLWHTRHGKTSLAVVHYFSGDVTKAERSKMQEFWQEVDENKSVSVTWSFVVRSLCIRECGVHEVGDLLLGDHFAKKFEDVKWVEVSNRWITKCYWKLQSTIQTRKRSLRTTILTPFIYPETSKTVRCLSLRLRDKLQLVWQRW